MDYVKKIVAQVVEGFGATDLSSACLATTNPVYLLFSSTCDAPVYVVRVTTSTQACTHEISVLLHEAAGDLVPEPLGVIQQDGKRFSIQRGVPGTPWFQIAHSYSVPARWNNLKAIATDTLQKFHHRIRLAMPGERRLFHPHEELHLAYQAFRKINVTVPSGLDARLRDCGQALESLGEVLGVPQHGDFSLNNLIIQQDPARVTIIDFEDFNLTQMPLYDEFTLALSFISAAPDALKLELHEELSSCIKTGSNSAEYGREVVEGLFLFHLLTRLGHWSLGTKRQPYRQWLLSLLDKFTQNPKTLFPE